ncbi:elongation factor G [Phaeobacter gallaeciensis]|uniref:elongation factor G n=1 Tax=Phaeobacter gallaeciensis TaxID=60890 RepID=UPI000BBB7F43|nr:elongation factor G [Phaeobacter gallaeciensis]ATF16855.1 Translation elongation factors (GTPase) [Phaeobacter gallaeciensis]ATF20964.1 Translation elongation factors (GTPase) [Phaeobacter gallaeciensis]
MRVFTLIGPSHSGKTELAKALATLQEPEQKPQQATGVAELRAFPFMDEAWGVIDIAGGVENLATAGPALAASDAAVVCVPADPSAGVLAAPYLRMIEEAGIPAFLFINRMDQAAGRVADIVAALQTYCRHNIVLRQIPMRASGEVIGAVDLISERAWKYQEGQPSALVAFPDSIHARERQARGEMLEALADYDDDLLEQLIEDRKPVTKAVYDVATRVLQHNDLIPALLGSALHRNGILRLMKSLRHEAPAVEVAAQRLAADGQPLAVGCIGDLVKHLGKTVVVRALSQPVGAGAQVGGGNLGAMTQLRDQSTAAKTGTSAPAAGRTAGNGRNPSPSGSGPSGSGDLAPGDIAQVVKSDHLSLGYAYLENRAAQLPRWTQPRPSSYQRIITPMNDRDDVRLTAALERIAEIDTGMLVEQDEISGHALLHLQGPLHLRRILGLLNDSFGIEVGDKPVPPALRETITRPVTIHHRHRKQSGGAGQFADVVLSIAPAARGSGFHFTDEVKGGAVPKGYIPSVEAGTREALKAGANGHPVVDVQVTLKDGKHHSVDSSDYAFRTAGKSAVREALAEAGSVVLQPIMRVEIHVPSVFTGGLVPVVSGMQGQILGFAAHPEAAGWDVFETLLPVAAQEQLCSSLASATRGTAWFSSGFDHYEEARRMSPAAS